MAGPQLWTSWTAYPHQVSDLELINGAIASLYDLTTAPVLKNSLVLNVKDAPYGAVGNGIADDTDAITAAIATGRPVYVPPGTYKCTFRGQDTTDTSMKWAFKLTQEAQIFGSGPDSILTTPDASTTLFWIEGATTGGRIHDLHMVGSGISSPHRATAVRLKGSTDWEIDRNVIENWGSHNLHLQDSAARNKVHHNYLSNSVAWNGVEIKDGCVRNWICFNYIVDSNDQGIECRNSTDNLIGWNVIVDSGLGAPSGPNSGIGLESGAHRNEIVGNRIYNSQRCGIQVWLTCDDNWVHHNTCDGNVSTTADLIAVKSDQTASGNPVQLANRNVVEHNQIRNSARDGVLIRSALDTIVRGNKVTACAGKGITVESFVFHDGSGSNRYKPLRTVVEQNQIWGVTAQGIHVTYADSSWITRNSVTATTNADPVTNAVDAIFCQNTGYPAIRENLLTSYRYGVRGDILTNHVIATNNASGCVTGIQLLTGSSAGSW